MLRRGRGKYATVERGGFRAHRASSSRNVLTQQKSSFETATPGAASQEPLTVHINKQAFTNCDLVPCEESKSKPWQYLHLAMKNTFFFNIPAASLHISYFPNLCLRNVATRFHLVTDQFCSGFDVTKLSEQIIHFSGSIIWPADMIWFPRC